MLASPIHCLSGTKQRDVSEWKINTISNKAYLFTRILKRTDDWNEPVEILSKVPNARTHTRTLANIVAIYIHLIRTFTKSNSYILFIHLFSFNIFSRNCLKIVIFSNSKYKCLSLFAKNRRFLLNLIKLY